MLSCVKHANVRQKLFQTEFEGTRRDVISLRTRKLTSAKAQIHALSKFRVCHDLGLGFHAALTPHRCGRGFSWTESVGTSGRLPLVGLNDSTAAARLSSSYFVCGMQGIVVINIHLIHSLCLDARDCKSIRASMSES